MHRRPKLLAAASIAGVMGSGEAFAESRDYNFPAFTRIDVSTGIGVHLTLGDEQSVRVSARSSDDFRHLVLSVRHGELIAATDYSLLDFVFKGGVLDALFREGPSIEMFVTLPEIDAVTASSGARIEGGEFRGSALAASASSGAQIAFAGLGFQRLNLSASSGGQVYADGEVRSLTADGSSGGTIDAARLATETAQAGASSGGRLVVNVTGTVDANASSGGNITILGQPDKANVNTASGGNVQTGR